MSHPLIPDVPGESDPFAKASIARDKPLLNNLVQQPDQQKPDQTVAMRVLDLLQNGKYWIKDHLCNVSPNGNRSYCLLGAYAFVLKGDRWFVKAVFIDGIYTNFVKEAIEDTIPYRALQNVLLPTRHVLPFNDNLETSWDDIKNALYRAHEEELRLQQEEGLR